MIHLISSSNVARINHHEIKLQIPQKIHSRLHNEQFRSLFVRVICVCPYARLSTTIGVAMDRGRSSKDRRQKHDPFVRGYLAGHQITAQHPGIGLPQQRQMRDRQQEQQKAQFRLPKARRPRDNSSAHNYLRSLWARTVKRRSRPLWSIFSLCRDWLYNITSIANWLFA